VRVQRRPMAMAMASGCWLWPKAIGEQCASHKGQSRKACRADPHKETLTPIRKNLWRNWSKRYGATEARATEWKKEPSRQWKTRRKRKTRKNGKDVQSEKEWGKPWKRGVDRCLEAARGRVERSGARKYVERGMTCGGVWRWVRSVRWLVRWCAAWPCRRLGGLGKKNGGRSDGANRDGGRGSTKSQPASERAAERGRRQQRRRAVRSCWLGWVLGWLCEMMLGAGTGSRNTPGYSHRRRGSRM
jgi:hypothetical protein